MGLLLNIETSATVCSVCIARDGVVIDYRESTEPNSHARLLTVLIGDLLTSNKIEFAELDAVAVSAGPGSYTGLRIGISVAKGLCYALTKPLIAVATLRSLAEGIKQKTARPGACYMPVLDARRMDVYTAIYNSSEEELFKTACVTIDQKLESELSAFGEIIIGGNAVVKCKGVFTLPNIFFLDDFDCDSRWMAGLAESKYREKDFADLAYFEPTYLKEYLPK